MSKNKTKKLAEHVMFAKDDVLRKPPVNNCTPPENGSKFYTKVYPKIK